MSTRPCPVRRELVVPHRPALQQGLASMDEVAVAALGFEHLVFMRMAQAADAVVAAWLDGAAPGCRL